MIEVAGANLARPGRQALHRPRNALGEIEAGPGRADEDHERHHDEERQVDTLNRPSQRPQLTPVLIRLDDLASVRRRLARQVIARENHSDYAACRIANSGAAANEVAAAFERLRREGFGPAAGNDGREAIGRCAHRPTRQAR